MAARVHTTPAAPSAIVPVHGSDAARLEAGASRLHALNEEAAAALDGAGPATDDTEEAVRADLEALIASAGQMPEDPAFADGDGPAKGAPGNMGDSHISDPALRPGLDPSPDVERGHVIHDRRALDGAAEHAVALGEALGIPAVDLSAVLANTGNSRISADPDADLLALGRAWQASAERCDRAADALMAAEEAVVYPEPPEALFCRPSDLQDFRGLTCEHAGGRPWFSCYAVETLRDLPLVDGAGPSVARLAARRDEVVAAADAWDAVCRAERDRTGATAALREDAEAAADNSRLRRRIMTTPAVTLAGVLAKARVAGWCGGDIEDMRAQVRHDAASGNLTGETMAFSLAVDLVAMLEDTASAPPTIGRVCTAEQAAALDFEAWTGDCPVPPNRDWPGIGAYYLPLARIAWCLNTRSKEDLMRVLADMDEDDGARVEGLCDDLRASREFFGAFHDLTETAEARILAAVSTMTADPRYRHRFAGATERGVA